MIGRLFFLKLHFVLSRGKNSVSTGISLRPNSSETLELHFLGLAWWNPSSNPMWSSEFIVPWPQGTSFSSCSGLPGDMPCSVFICSLKGDLQTFVVLSVWHSPLVLSCRLSFKLSIPPTPQIPIIAVLWSLLGSGSHTFQLLRGHTVTRVSHVTHLLRQL